MRANLEQATKDLEAIGESVDKMKARIAKLEVALKVICACGPKYSTSYRIAQEALKDD